MAKPAPTPAAPPHGPEPERVEVGSRRVACDGVGGALGHPRVWVEIGAAGFADCLYCDRRFQFKAGAHASTPGVYEAGGGH